MEPPEVSPKPEEVLASLPPYVRFVAEFLNRALAVVAAKNQDYAGDDASPLWNFENAARTTRTTVPTVLVSRLVDKVSRLSNLSRKRAAVSEETADDTCLDLVGYACILAYYYSQQAQEPTPPKPPKRPKKLKRWGGADMSSEEWGRKICGACDGMGYNDIAWDVVYDHACQHPKTGMVAPRHVEAAIKKAGKTAEELGIRPCSSCQATGLKVNAPCSSVQDDLDNEEITDGLG